MKKEERRRPEGCQGVDGGGWEAESIYLNLPGAHTESWTSKRAYLPKYDSSYFVPTLQETEGTDQFPSWQKRTRGSFKVCEIFQATMSLE